MSSYPSEEFDYQLLDTGSFQKLEQFGPHRFCRPAPQALWPKSLPKSEWNTAEGEYKYFKSKDTGGEWKLFTKLPENGWQIKFQHLIFRTACSVKDNGGVLASRFPSGQHRWMQSTDWLV